MVKRCIGWVLEIMKKIGTILPLLIVILLSLGCSTKYINSPVLSSPMDRTNISDHFIYIDKQGILRDNCNNKITEIKDYEKYIDNIFYQFEELRKVRNNLKLTIYIHGGLNTFNHTVERITNTYEHFLSENQYPVFVSWQSSFFSNYIDHLFVIRNGEEGLLTAILSSPFVFIEDMLRSVARIPVSYWNILFGQNHLMVKYWPNKKDRDPVRNSKKRITEADEFHIHKIGVPPSMGHNFLDFATIWNPIKFVTAPFIDGFGKGSWRLMLRRTDLVLNSQSGFDGEEIKKSRTAVYYFFNALQKKYQNINITLIGHSMGTIIANNIVNRFPDINFKDIVYMAAACKLKDLESSIVPWLRKDKRRNFYNLSLNPYRDINENEYQDFIPRGSLLIWIDDFLEEVNSFEDRTAGYWFNIIRSAEIIFPSDIRKQVHLTRYGIKNKTPQIHGAFDDYNFWSRDFWENKEDKIWCINNDMLECTPVE